MSPDRQSHPASGTDRPVSALRMAGLVAGPLGAAALLWLTPPAGMPLEAWRMLAITLWMVIWWLSEALPIPATALLPLVLMPALGVQDMSATAMRYANPLIFLFLGGFLLAAAMQRVGLHRRIALRIVSIAGTAPNRIVLGFMLATAFLSMWISNTATTIMMFTVALSVIDFVSRQSRDDGLVRNFGVALMLAIAYSASIGGVGTLIGSPPNAMLASFVQQSYGIEVSFARWMMIGLPVVIVMLPVTWLLLTRHLFPASMMDVGDTGGHVRAEIAKMGPMNRGERLVAVVFCGAALGWMLRAPLARLTGLPLDDAMIAITAALILFAVPLSRGSGRYALDWAATRDLPWGILLLFGGGLALASGFSTSGLARVIGESVAGIEVGTVLLVLAVLIAIVYLTEITSNTASTATFLPILGAVALGLELDVLTLTVPVALGASMAFMMPVATPPNAIVFSYERMQMSDMVRAGALMNIIAIAVTFGVLVLLGPMMLGISL
ncbi:DASS family sodium-coupled anion symporter [Roseovarius sp. EGI FJ00037]|uniref:SLC13 family permease n=1 Tax=Roseovarius salincola TaxID=2978479 RepID=UPI0022A81F14|nr:DASS family sodium-coupled anion symporter [Roseovarius sp. EGI FJ00037]MCZ0814009.1 DASS family sodium-coupled anion symporter [Roseovarius sp. EGI FJ00037]